MDTFHFYLCENVSDIVIPHYKVLLYNIYYTLHIYIFCFFIGYVTRTRIAHVFWPIRNLLLWELNDMELWYRIRKAFFPVEK